MAGINELLVGISEKVATTATNVTHIIGEQKDIKTAMFGKDGNGGLMRLVNDSSHALQILTDEHVACMEEKVKDKKALKELEEFKKEHERVEATKAARIKSISMMLGKGGITITGVATVLMWLWDKVFVPVGNAIKHLFI